MNEEARKNVMPEDESTSGAPPFIPAYQTSMDLPNCTSKELPYEPPATEGLTTSTSAPVLRLVPVPQHRDRRQLNFTILGSVGIALDEDDLAYPGCSVLDLIFQSPSQVGELVFRNYYTAWITVLAYFQHDTNDEPTDSINKTVSVRKAIGPLPGGARPLSSAQPGFETSVTTVSNNSEKIEICEWSVVLPHRELMPDPHYELGSQDLISIPATECQVAMNGIRAMRLVLHQPSPVWRTFHIEDLNVYSDTKDSPTPQIPHSHPITTSVYCSHYDPLLALVRHQTVGAIYKNKNKVNFNVPNNLEAPTYEFFSLPQI